LNKTTNEPAPTVPQQKVDPAKTAGTAGRWKPVVLLVTIVAVLIVAKVLGLGERLGELRLWIDSLGAWGPLVFVFLYAVAVVAAVPGSALTVASGALFGSALGVIVVSAGSTLGASLSFLIARHFARGATARWLKKNEKFRQLDELTQKRGAIIVALTRLVPLFPFNLLNYGFGLTAVPFWTYVFWSWLCMLPGTAVYVMGGDAFTRGLSQGGLPWGLIAAVVVAVILLLLLVRYAQKKLKENETRTEPK
jgi:uncharacterized membrane protein YdjX (TVP38/TMEM64 family)